MKNKKAIFFDLDGTLLPVDLDRMFEAYFELLKKSEVLGMLDRDVDRALAIFNGAVGAMMQNKGAASNAAVFFEHLCTAWVGNMEAFAEKFNLFYATVFGSLAGMVEKRDTQRKILDTVLAKGYTTVLATMPVFPISAAAARLSWVGLQAEDFSYISHYENSSYLKPHIGYYTEILKNTGLVPEECYMVGNNVEEDMCAAQLGFDVFLVTGYEIGKYNKNEYRSGDIDALLAWAQSLPRVEEWK